MNVTDQPEGPTPNGADHPETTAPPEGEPSPAQPTASTTPPWYERKGLLVPSVVVVAPLGAVLMWLSQRWPLWAKGLATAWAALVILGLVAGGLYARGHGFGLRGAPAWTAVTSARNKGTPGAQAAATPKPKKAKAAKPATPAPTLETAAPTPA